MIVKSLSRRTGSTGQLLRYILRYTTEEKQQKESEKKQVKQQHFLIRHNLRARSLNGFIREFEKVESLRQYKRSNSVSVYHHILSFSSKDKALVTDAMLKDLAEKFIELRGQDNLYIGIKHADKEHIHLHLAMSAVDVAGHAARISKAQFQNIKLMLDSYQKEHYPELSNSLPEHGRKNKVLSRTVIKEEVKFARASEKETLLNALQINEEIAGSLEELISSLQKQGYAPYYRNGKLAGLTGHEGRKYGLTRLGYAPEKLQALFQQKGSQVEKLTELKVLRKQGTEKSTSVARTAILSDECKKNEAILNDEEKELVLLQSLRDDSRSSSRGDDIEIAQNDAASFKDQIETEEGEREPENNRSTPDKCEDRNR